MKTRRREAFETFFAAGLLLLAAVLANLVAGRWPARADLTAERRFTLAPETRALLATPEAEVEVRAYLPENVAAPYGTVVRAVRDRLEEYRAASGGRLRLVWRDPTDPALDAAGRAALAEEAKGYGIREADLQVMQADRRVRQRVLMGVAFLYRDRQAATPPIEDPDRIEYALTRALREALRGPGRKPVIGVARGHGEPDLLAGPLAEVLGTSGTLRDVTIDGRPLPGDIDVLVVLSPTRPFSARERYVVDQFLMQGRALVLLQDYRQQSTVFPDVLVPQASGLEPLLDAYGLKIDAEATIVDRTHSLPVPFGRDASGRPMSVNHPLFASTDAIERAHPVTRGLPSLVLPMAAPITVSGRLETTALVRTSPDARARADVRSLDPQRLIEGRDADAERPGPFTVAVAASGELDSAWADPRQPVPPPPSRGDAPPASEEPPVRRSQGEARLVVVTAGLRMLGLDRNALLLFQNAVDWALIDTDLVGIRARRATDPPLDAVAPERRNLAKFGNILGPPALVIAFGLVRGWRRRRGR
jgi:hypothetical protein